MAIGDRVVRLIWKADTSQARKGIRAVADESSSAARRVRDENRKANESFRGMRSETGRLHGAVSGLAGAAGLGALGLSLSDSVHSALQLETAQTQLRGALQATGQAGAGAYKQLSDYADKLSIRGGFGSTQNLQSLAQFTRQTGSATQATKLLGLATDIARARGTDLATAQQIVARAASGSTGRLQQLLGPLVAQKSAVFGLTQQHAELINSLRSEAKAMGKAGPAWLRQQEIINKITPQQEALAQLQDKHATAQQLLAASMKVFGGAASQYSKTSAGQIENTKHSVENLRDSLALGLLPIVTKGIKIFAGFATFLAKNRPVLYALVAAVAAVSTVMLAHAAVMAVVDAHNYLVITSNRLLGTSFGLWGRSARAAAIETDALIESEDGAALSSGLLGAAMNTIPILAIITGIVLIATHWKQFKRIVDDVWHYIKGHSILLALIPGIGPLLFFVTFVVTHFAKIKHAVSDTAHFIGHIASTVWHALTWPFVQGWDLIKRIFKKIKGTALDYIGTVMPIVGIATGHGLFGKIGHAIGSIFHTGGVVQRPKYLAGGGPAGSDVVPAWLTPGEGVLNRAAMNTIGSAGLHSLNSGAGVGGGFTIVPAPIIIKLDSRILTRSVVDFSLRRAARGPTTLSGGSVVTGTPVTNAGVGGSRG